MSSFTGFDCGLYIRYCPEASRILGRDYWLLHKGFTYYIGKLNSDMFVEVPKGFLSDGASVPRLARILLPRMGSHSQASFLHDWLCEEYTVCYNVEGGTMCLSIDRVQIDRIYYEALKVSRVSFWRRFFIRVGVGGYRILFRPKRPKVNQIKRKLEEEFRKEL